MDLLRRGVKVVFRIPYALPLGGDSRARSTARAYRRDSSIPLVTGCAPPSTRRAVRSVSSSVATASRRSSSVALESWSFYIVSDDLVTSPDGSNPCTWEHGSGAEFQRYTMYPNKSLHAGSRSLTTSKRRATGYVSEAARTAPARRASASSSPWSPRWWPPSEKAWTTVAATRRMN